MSQGVNQVVNTLFVTLRRSYAGTPWFHRRVLEALGLKHRHQCVEKPNNSSIRGMLEKVPHLVIIETDRMRYLRDLKAYHEQLPRDPWVLHHDPLLLYGQAAAGAQTAALPAEASGALMPVAAAAPTQGVRALSQPPRQPRFTPFVVQNLREHLDPVDLEGYDAMAQRPQVPGKYMKEKARQWRVKVLTERGIFSSDAIAEHNDALRAKSYRRRVGVRDS